MVWADLSADEVLARVTACWDLTGPLPLPKPGWMKCGVCGGSEVQVRYWRFHKRTGTPTLKCRVDVSFKCCTCSALLPTFGVAVPDDWFEANVRKIGRQLWHREARKILEAS